MATIVLVEDEKTSQLYPVTVGRPAFAVSCGSFRLLDLLAGSGHRLVACVRPHLRAIVKADYPQVSADLHAAGDAVVVVNARLAPRVSTCRQVVEWAAKGRPGVVRTGEDVAVAVLGESGRSELASLVAAASATATLPSPGLRGIDLQRLVDGLPALSESPLPLLDYPHDIVRLHLESLAENLQHRLATGTYREIAPGVFAADSARLGEYVVSDTSQGPVVLERGATIGPHSYLVGPAHLGEGARVLEHAAIKGGVALGHTTKIGGEVEGSIVEPFTNKQHHGFLGHSYLGSWVNLGAGTCNSDLKNTYGQVNMEYGGRKVQTGMQFVGAIIGDYAKTAINTGIFTGKTVGACSMVYGFVTTNVPSFVNYARLFGQVTEAPVEVMIATQARMFTRRNVAQRPCDVQLLHDMYELTRHERQLAGEPLSL